MSTVQIDDTPLGTILTYGSVELRLCHLYAPGDIVSASALLRLEVVDRVEYADGIVVLSTTPRPQEVHPSVLGILFTHYIRHALLNHIDHRATHQALRHPSALLRRMTEAAFHQDITKRSLAASFAFQPSVRYFA